MINALLEKRTVNSVERLEEQIFKINRNGGLNDIVIYVVDAYVLGKGAALEIIEENPSIDAILVISNWDSYTYEAKKAAEERNVEIYDFGGLMSAVYH